MGQGGMEKRAHVTVARLRRRADFVRVKEAGWRVATPYFALQIFENKEQDGVLVGFTATTRTIGNAVARNRARRRMKALFDQYVRLNPAWDVGGLWLVMVARPGVGEAKWEVLQADMEKALKKLKDKQ